MQLTTVKCCIAILITLNYVFSLAGDSLTSENDQEIKSNNVKYELDTAGGVQVSPVVERTPAEEAMKTIDHIVNNLPEIDAMSSVHEPESSANVDHQLQSLESGTLGDGEILDGLLNQLDVADKEILALTDEREALLVTIDEMKKTEYSFANEIAALRRELTSYNETVTDLRSQITTLQGSHQVSTESKQEERQVFETEKQELLDKIVLAERNSSGLAIKAKLERNERTIAQLSYQNCLLELEGVRSGQLDDMSELRTELAALKRKREVKCKPCSSTQNDGRTLTNGECDTSAIINSFVSKYLLFWAEEHQSPSAEKASTSAPVKETSDSSRSSSSTSKQQHNGHDDTAHRNLQYEEMVGYFQFGMRTAKTGVDWLTVQLTSYIYPALCSVISFEIEALYSAARVTVSTLVSLWDGYLSSAWFNVIQPNVVDFYTLSIVPLYWKYMHPLYTAHVEGAVNAGFSYYERNEAWIDQRLSDPLDYIVGRLHYAFYFTMVFFSPEEIGHNMQGVWFHIQNFVPTVIELLSSLPPVQAQLGEKSEMVVTAGVYTTVAVFLYLSRRVIFGVVALVAMLVLSPLLLAIYLSAKLLGSCFKPRKKSSRRNTGGSGSGSGGSSGGGSGVKASRHTSARPTSFEGGRSAAGVLSPNMSANINSNINSNTSGSSRAVTQGYPVNVPVINAVPAAGYLSSQQQLRDQRPRNVPAPISNASIGPVHSSSSSSGSGGIGGGGIGGGASGGALPSRTRYVVSSGVGGTSGSQPHTQRASGYNSVDRVTHEATTLGV